MLMTTLYIPCFLSIRLSKEYEKLCKDKIKGVDVYLPSESDVYTWEAVVDGPEDSLYKGC